MCHLFFFLCLLLLLFIIFYLLLSFSPFFLVCLAHQFYSQNFITQNYFNFHDGGPCHIETSPLQINGLIFYLIGTSIMKELRSTTLKWFDGQLYMHWDKRKRLLFPRKFLVECSQTWGLHTWSSFKINFENARAPSRQLIIVDFEPFIY